MRKFYIFSYESGLNTSMGHAGYHGHFSIAGHLTIFSTREKANIYMDELTSLKPDKKHKLMSRANARKHCLGDTMDEFNYFIENNIDLYAEDEEEEEEQNEEEEEKNTFAKFLITHIEKDSLGFDNFYRGIFIAHSPNFYSDKEKKEEVNLVIGDDLEFSKVAFFTEQKGAESSENFSELLSPLMEADAKILDRNAAGTNFYLEYDDGTGYKTYIKAEPHKDFNSLMQLNCGD